MCCARAPALLLALLFLASFSLPAPAQSDEINVGIYRVRVATHPSTPGVGRCRLTVYVNRPFYNTQGHLDVRPSSGLRVTVLPTMPQMPAMKVASTPLNETRAGCYEGDISFTMAGSWVLHFDFSGRDGNASLNRPFTVAERAGGDAANPAQTASSPPAPAPSPASTAPSAASPSQFPADSNHALPTVTARLIPGRVGDNTIRIDVLDSNGRPLSGVDVLGGLTMGGMFMTVPPRAAQPASDGSYALGARLTMPGLWTLTVDVNRAATRMRRQSFDLTVLPLANPWVERWPTIVLCTVIVGVAAVGGLRLLGTPRRGSLRGLVGCLLCLGVPLGVGEIIRGYWPPDTSMGMRMDMNAPDMGLSMADMSAPLPVVMETVVRRPLYAMVAAQGIVQSRAASSAPLRIVARVPQLDVERLHVGTLTYVTAPGHDPLKATVADVGARVDQASQTVDVRVEVTQRPMTAGVLPRGSHGLPAGLKVDLRFVAERNDVALPIPMSALFESFGHPAVWTVEDVCGQLVVRRRPVHLGIEVDELVDAMGGLDAGTRIVTTHVEPLEEGTVVTPATLGAGPYRNLLMPATP